MRSDASMSLYRETLARAIDPTDRTPKGSISTIAPMQRALYERLLQEGNSPSEAEALVEKTCPSGTYETRAVFRILYESRAAQACSLTTRGFGRIAKRVLLPDPRWKQLGPGEWSYRGWSQPVRRCQFADLKGRTCAETWVENPAEPRTLCARHLPKE